VEKVRRKEDVALVQGCGLCKQEFCFLNVLRCHWLFNFK